MSGRINHAAVWVAAVVYYLFGISFVLRLILAYATAIALARRPEDQTVQQGVAFAVFMGLAIYATQTLNNALSAGQPIALWRIDTGYVVIGFAIIGAILGGWKKQVVATA